MNLLHRWICNSNHWKRHVETELVPWGLDGLDLGDNVLEIGPGYGKATDLLRDRAPHLTCLEVDGSLAASLSRRMTGTNVRVLPGDGAHIPVRDSIFSAVVCFTMLHHVPTPALQDSMLAEVARVLRPGGVFAGTDSVTSLVFRFIHIGDTMIMVDPETFPARLRAVGFEDIEVIARRHEFRFRARKG